MGDWERIIETRQIQTGPVVGPVVGKTDLDVRNEQRDWSAGVTTR